jgi:hypothetical protein
MQWLADARDSTAVTLMGWAAKLATRQYQQSLAVYLNLGMSVYDHDQQSGEEEPTAEYEVLLADQALWPMDT